MNNPGQHGDQWREDPLPIPGTGPESACQMPTMPPRPPARVRLSSTTGTAGRPMGLTSKAQAALRTIPRKGRL